MIGKYKYIIALIAIALITHIAWFSPSSILTHGDWQFRTDHHVVNLVTEWNTWLGYSGLGSPNVLVSSFPLRGIFWSSIVRLGLSYDIAIKLSLLIPIALLGFLSPFFLFRKLTKNDLIAFSVALFYGTTTYFLRRQTNHLPIAFLYSFAPLIYFFFLKAVESTDKRIWIFLSMLFAYDLRIMLLIAILPIFQLLLLGYKYILSHAKYFILAFIIFLLLNLYWLLPYILGDITSSIHALTDRGLFGDHLFSLTQAITIFDSSWTGYKPNLRFENQPILFHAWIIPFLLLILMLSFKSFSNKKKLQFWIILALVGIFLTKQSAEPFSKVYASLYENVPFFNLFRESSKFYLLTAFGYAGILGLGLLNVFKQSHKGFFYVLIVISSIPAVFNLWPLFTKDIGTMFISRSIPTDYSRINSLIESSPDFYRIYWIPRDPRWISYSSSQPKISAASFSYTYIYNHLIGHHSSQIENDLMQVLESSYSNELLDSISVKYVMIPLEDNENDDNFYFSYGKERQSDIKDWYFNKLLNVNYLTHIDHGTEQVEIFENKDYLPYIRSFSSLIDYGSKSNFDEKNLFISNMMPNKTNFVLNISSSNIPASKLETALDNHVKPQIDQSMFTLSLKEYIGHNNKLYIDSSVGFIKYTFVDETLALFDQRDPILVAADNSHIGTKIENILFELSLNKQESFFAKIGANFHKLRQNKFPVLIGRNAEQTILYRSSSDNGIENFSFEDGPWSNLVGDCNAYDDKPILGMGTSSSATEGRASLELKATRHTACTNPDLLSLGTTSTSYLLSFDYQSPQLQHASFHISFDDDTRSFVSKRLPATSTAWHTHQQLIEIPEGATTARLTVYSYPTDNESEIITRYDNFRFSALEEIARIEPIYKPDWVSIDLADIASSSPDGTYTFRYDDPLYDSSNKIQNPAFDKGLWKKNVGNCNAYDDEPDIDMILNRDETSGYGSVLELQARRHTACTRPNIIPVKENTNYQLSFDYLSPNAKQAGFHVGFNDPQSSSVSERVKIEEYSTWAEFTTQIRVPAGASTASLTVYGYPPSDGKEEYVTRYDNFSLIELPYVTNRYYLVSDPQTNFVDPHDVEFNLIDPTKKLVRIRGASTPFYLAMSESYHDQWLLMMDNENVNKGVFSWLPFAKPDRVADEHHFKLNSFLNGWFVDIDVLCRRQALCVENPDGTYDMDMMIQFWPQRWFYLGLLISGTTFLSLVIYLLMTVLPGPLRTRFSGPFNQIFSRLETVSGSIRRTNLERRNPYPSRGPKHFVDSIK